MYIVTTDIYRNY